MPTRAMRWMRLLCLLVGLSTEEMQSTIEELNKGKADIRLVLSDDMTNDDMEAIKSVLGSAR